jgi:hypothetical protein
MRVKFTLITENHLVGGVLSKEITLSRAEELSDNQLIDINNPGFKDKNFLTRTMINLK